MNARVMLKRKYNGAVARLCRKNLYLNTYMNLTDNTRLEIENCRRIIEYNDVYIRLATSTLTMQVWGEKLKISDYNTDGIVIEGVFSSVEFEK